MDERSIDRVVVNWLSSVGETSPKAWFESLVRYLADDVPFVEMHADDIICFEEVVLNFHPCPYTFEDEDLLWRDASLYDSFSMPQVLSWARARVWAAVDAAQPIADPIEDRDYVLYARQGMPGISVKKRSWENYQEVAEALNAEVIDFASLSFTEEVKLMRSARVFLTVPGAHHAAAFFLRPGATWIELHCPHVSNAFYWYRGFVHLVAALGIEYVSVEAANCPIVAEDTSEDAGEVWVPITSHPVRSFARLQGYHVTAVDRQLCTWKEVQSDWVPEKLDILETMDSHIEAIRRCMQWDHDCQSLQEGIEGDWHVLRQRRGTIRKHACVERNGSYAIMSDRSVMVQHALYDGSLLSPADFVDFARSHHSARKRIPFWLKQMQKTGRVTCSRSPEIIGAWIWPASFDRFIDHYEGVIDVSELCQQAFSEECVLYEMVVYRFCAWVLAERSLADIGGGCDSIPLDRVVSGERWITLADTIGNESDFVQSKHDPSMGHPIMALDEGFEERARHSLDVANTYLRKVWARTDKDEEEFKSFIPHLPALKDPALTVCVVGATISAKESMCFVHFAWGHLVAVTSALAREGLLGHRLKFLFTEPEFMCPPSQWLAYYGLWSDELPRYDPQCTGADRNITLTSPIHIHYEEPEVEAQVGEAAWRNHLRDCQVRPAIHPALVTRLNLNMDEGSNILLVTWVRRGEIGAIPRRNTPVKDVRNADEIRHLLKMTASSHSWKVDETSFDGWPWYRQVALIALTDVLLAFHGSVVGAHEPWLKSGALSIEVMLNHTCHCPYAYCAAYNTSRDLQWVLATTSGVNCSLGDWVGRMANSSSATQLHETFSQPGLVWPNWDEWNEERGRGGRSFNPRRILSGIAWQNHGTAASRFRDWAQATLPNAGRACGGLAIQVSD